MNRFSNQAISDELLSAYIDGAVTEDERKRVEVALAADPEVAWRYETLRQTVTLLRSLPHPAPPRSFALSKDQAEDVFSRPRAREQRRPQPRQLQPAGGWWQALMAFVNSGAPVWRNASAVAGALFVVLLLGSTLLRTPAPSVAPLAAPPQAQAPTETPMEEPGLPSQLGPTAAQAEETPTQVAALAVPEKATSEKSPGEETNSAPGPLVLEKVEGEPSPLPEPGERAAVAPRSLQSTDASTKPGPGVAPSAESSLPAEKGAPPAPAFAAQAEPQVMGEAAPTIEAQSMAVAATPEPGNASTPGSLGADAESITPPSAKSPPVVKPESTTPPLAQAGVPPKIPGPVAQASPTPSLGEGIPTEAGVDLWLVLQGISLLLAVFFGGLWLRSRRA